MIRTATTKQFRALSEMDAEIRWCLTGTPIQNGLEDLGALIAFLRMPLLEDPATFRDHIINPTKTQRSSGFANLCTLLRSICLRRTRELLGVPEPETEERGLEFCPTEAQNYKNVSQRCKQRIDVAINNNDIDDARNGMLDTLYKLRVLCNIGTFAMVHASNSDQYAFPEDGIGEMMSNSSRKRKRGENKLTLPEAENSDESQKVATKIQALASDVRQHVGSSKSLVFSFWQNTLDVVEVLFRGDQLKFCRLDGSMSLSERRTALNKFKSDPSIVALLITLGTGAEG